VILGLKIFFSLVFASLLGLCIHASRQRALWDLPREITTDPWFLATLLDAYCGFLIAWLWIGYRERRLVARIGWLLAVLALGNMGVAFYALLQLSRLQPGDPLERLLTRPDSSSRL
jgi:hypothetical protein